MDDVTVRERVSVVEMVAETVAVDEHVRDAVLLPVRVGLPLCVTEGEGEGEDVTEQVGLAEGVAGRRRWPGAWGPE